MSVEFSVDVAGMKTKEKGKRIRDYRQPLRAAEGIVLRETQANFNAERSPEGSGWAALSPVTIERKGHARKLWETGALYSSITASNDGKSVTISSSDFKAAFHQYGTSKMPARPFLGISYKMKNEIAGAVRAYIRGR